MRERRRGEGYKLRIYMDAIKDAKALTNSQWIENWVRGNCDSQYITKDMWVSYLEKCALQEAKVFLESKAS